MGLPSLGGKTIYGSGDLVSDKVTSSDEPSAGHGWPIDCLYDNCFLSTVHDRTRSTPDVLTDSNPALNSRGELDNYSQVPWWNFHEKKKHFSEKRFPRVCSSLPAAASSIFLPWPEDSGSARSPYGSELTFHERDKQKNPA